MKKLGKIKLNQFSKDELDRRKLNALKGGCDCSNYRIHCSCSGVHYTYEFHDSLDNASDLRASSGY